MVIEVMSGRLRFLVWMFHKFSETERSPCRSGFSREFSLYRSRRRNRG